MKNPRADGEYINSLAKGSTYFIPKYIEKTHKFAGKPLDMTIKMKVIPRRTFEGSTIE